MSFSTDWLTLRADADARARNPALAEKLRQHFADWTSIRVLDLGAGTGNNMRATQPFLPPHQHWRLIDNDPQLLAGAQTLPNTTVETVVADLANDIGALLADPPDLVTASAFFDLCSATWLQRFARSLAGSGAAFYTVLSYDGRENWKPPHEMDATILAAFHTDQRRDKGFGPSLGPDAHGFLANCLRDHGYRVHEGSSDWRLESGRDSELIAALAKGSATAVADHVGNIEVWEAARRNASSALIGHQDLLALPG
ncbi:MAG: SAM-dependent methyltransferase [Pseudomonadota bacterium]